MEIIIAEISKTDSFFCFFVAFSKHCDREKFNPRSCEKRKLKLNNDEKSEQTPKK